MTSQISSWKSKICPRCRFPLSKTHQEKQICKRCGYTSNKLQVVREGEAFQTKLKYTNKIHMKKNASEKIQISCNDSLLPTYLSAFQKIMKKIFRQFQKHFFNSDQSKFQQSQSVYKQIWFGYLMKMNQEQRPIQGIFKKLLNKQKKQAKKQVEQNEVKQDEDQQSESQKQNNQENLVEDEAVIRANQLLEIEQNQDNNHLNQNINNSKKRNNSELQNQKDRKDKKEKQTSFSQKVKIIFMKSLKQQNYPVLQQLVKASKGYEQFPTQIIKHIAEKYALLQAQTKLYRKDNKSVRQKINQIKHNKKYAKIKDLKELLELKNQNLQKSINKKYSLQLILLTYDLLAVWHKQTLKQKQNFPFEYMIVSYRSNQNRSKFIDAIIKQMQMNTQPQLIKKYQDSKKLFPQPSHSMIIALIYLTVLTLGKQITLIQIINFTVDLLRSQNYQTETQQQKEVTNLLIQQIVKVRKVKKIGRQIIRYLNLKISLTINQWALKYAELFELQNRYTKAYTYLTNILFKGFFLTLQNQLQQMCTLPLNQKRYIVLQQEQIVLSCLTIFLKLQFGLERKQYPYLVNCTCLTQKNISGLHKIQNKSQLKKSQVNQIIQKIMNINKSQISQQNPNLKQFQRSMNSNIFFIFQKINEKRRNIATISSYKDLNNKSSKEMLNYFKFLARKNQNNKITLTHFYKFNFKKQSQIKYTNKSNQSKDKNQAVLSQKSDIHQQIKLTKQFEEQIKILIEKKQTQQKHDQYQNNVFCNISLLDFPSSNYQFLYDSSIDIYHHLGFDSFLFVVQQLSFVLNGQHNNCKQIIEWISRLQSILINFQTQ